jgi:type III secretory pathway component EscS
MTKSELDYSQQLKRDFGKMIDALDLTDLQKDYLRSRWLDQVLWMESRANTMRNWYRKLRLTTIIVSGFVPVLVSINSSRDQGLEHWLKVVTVGISAIVTISSAIEEFFQFGDRWYNYRKSVELLKTQGWQFLQLSGSYHLYKTHSAALPIFTEEVEGIIQRDVQVYTTEMVRSRQQDDDPDPTDATPE